MLATTIHCPDCDATLRLGNPLPAGKKIKCPKCSSIFAVPEPEAEESRPAAAIKAKTSPKPPAKRRTKIDDDDPVDDYPAARSKSKAVRNSRVEDDYQQKEDLEDEEDNDDFVARRARKPAKNGKKAKSNTGLLIGLISGGVVLLLGLFALGAWVWPGFLTSSSKDGKGAKDGQVADTKGGAGGGSDVPAATGKEQLFAYAPGNSNLFLGLDMVRLQKLDGYTQAIAQIKANPQMAQADLPPGSLDLMLAAEKILIAGNVTQDTGVFVIKTSKPYSRADLVNNLKLTGQPQKVKDRIYYKLAGNTPQGRPPMGGMGGMQGGPPAGMGGAPPVGFGGNRGGPPAGMGGFQGRPPAGVGGFQGGPGVGGQAGMQGGPPVGGGGGQPAKSTLPWFVGMPNDRVVVLAQIPDSSLEECLGSDGNTSKVAAAGQALMGKLESKSFWFAYQLDDAGKQRASAAMRQAPAEFRPLVDAVNHLQWLSGSVALTDEIKLDVAQVQLDLAATCDNETAARNITNTLQTEWKKYKALINLALPRLGLPQEITTAINELSGSLKLETQGTVAQGSCQVGRTTLGRAIEAAKRIDPNKFRF